MTRTAVYRLYDANDVLLYIGSTEKPHQRFLHHRAQTTWWDKVVRQDLEWYDDREAAEVAERKAIASEDPVHNVQHSKVRKPHPKDSYMDRASPFWRYMNKVTRCTPNMIAKHMGDPITPSEVNRWYEGPPDQATTINFARIFGKNPIAALVAAGHLTPREGKGEVVTLDGFTDDELVAELQNRLKARSKHAA